jgi:glutamate-1-semialdehyde 2,1-aminomutase
MVATDRPAAITSFGASKALQARAHDLIPGGAHTYAKGDDQYPERAPAFLSRGQGCHVWDPDGNEYIEYGMGLRAVTLGHAYPSVVEAAYQAMLNGNNFVRPAPLEVECAEAVLGVLDGPEMVKFAKDGSTVVTAAVKLARAYTGRTLVAVCADHPFFSYNDWFIGTTDMDAGIPPVETSLTVSFHYNDLDSLRALFEQYPGQIAAVLMEAHRADEPAPGFLPGVQQLCRTNGALFILDEMITGFRYHLQGAAKVFGLDPDLSTFGKAMSNGFSLSALVGRREIMELGGLRTERPRVFLLSTTHGAESPALAATIETIRIYQTEPVIETLHRQGERLRAGVECVTAELGVGDYFGVLGRGCNLVYYTRDPLGRPSQPFRALFMQELIARGVIGPSFIVSYSHTDRDIDDTVEAVHGALEVYRRALEQGSTDGLLVGPPLKPVYRRYN